MASRHETQYNTEQWTTNPNVLFTEWWEIIPVQWMSATRKTNAITRLVILIGIASVFYYFRTGRSYNIIEPVTTTNVASIQLAHTQHHLNITFAIAAIAALVIVVILGCRLKQHCNDLRKKQHNTHTKFIDSLAPIHDSDNHMTIPTQNTTTAVHDVDARAYARNTLDLTPEKGRDTTWLMGGKPSRREFDHN